MIFFGVLFHLNQKISYYAQNLPFPHTLTIHQDMGGYMERDKIFRR